MSGNETLLLVDDEEGIRTVLGISLADAGYAVHTAASGEAALALFDRLHPAIVLTDIKMPGMDGIELLRRIKALDPETEVIMITGHGDMELAIESIKHEATDFVTKPVNPDVLEIALKRANDRLRMNRQLRHYTENLEELVRKQAQRLVDLERLTAIGQAVEGVAAVMGGIAGDLVGGLGMLEEMPCFVAIHNRQLEVVATNRLLRERLGERVGQASWTLFEGSGHTRASCPAARTFETGRGQRCRAEIVYPGGERHPVIVHTAPIRNSDGDLELVVELAADMSEMRRLQQALETTQQRYQQLFDEAPCFIAVLDRDLRIQATNHGYEAFFGRAVGQPCYRVCKRRSQPCDDCPVAATFADGAGHQVETVVIGSDGQRRTVLVRTTALTSRTGQVTQVMEMATDITEIRLLQDNLANLGLMVGSVSHGIKGILTGLDAGLYLIETGREKAINDRIERGIGKVRGMSERMRKVVQDLLYCAKPRPPLYEDIDPATLARDCAAVAADRVGGRPIDFQLDLPAERVTFEGEESHLHTALVNLLDNAVDACRSDAAPSGHRIVLRVRGDGDWIVFEVEDDGPGMEEDARGRLFDLFYSSKGSRGTGLGLFLVQRVVSQHGGHIEVRTEVGQGACFRVRLPRRKPAETD